MPLTTIIIVLIGVLLNNANMNAHFGNMNARFGSMNAGVANIDRGFTELKGLIQICSDRQDANFRRFEVVMVGKFAELDNRLSASSTT